MGQDAQAGYRKLAADDDRHHPGLHEIHLHQRDERGDRQQLVGKGIDELTERGDLMTPPRQIAVEPVGEGRDREDRGANELFPNPENHAPLELREEHHHEQRHQKNSRDRQRVRQVHVRASGP